LGLAIGLMAKGPLALVLAGLPLGLWTLRSREWGLVWRALPWWRGSLLLLVLVLPWYVLAEQRTPGFLNYFLLGEHWHRFVTPGWSGDRYGGAHAVPWGSIWAYAWVATLPWSLLLPLAWWRWRHAPSASPRSAAPVAPGLQPRERYLLLWSLAPAVFFTFAGNILWTYVLPAIPALALLGAAWLSRRYDDDHVNRWLTGGLATSGVLLIGLMGAISPQPQADFHTTKALVAEVSALNKNSSTLLFYPARSYSASFYTQGQAKTLTKVSDIWDRMAWPHSFLAVKASAEDTLPPELRKQLHFLFQRGDYKLFEMGSTVSPDPSLAPSLAAPALAKP
jgi:4-amino-4-deoxy-L-arabinose transferase-like glycosyltransferase